MLDEWQELVLQAAMGERRDQTWSAKRVGLSVPRQNGKSQLLVARVLAGALLFGERKIVVSAHQQDTSRESFVKLLEIIEADGNDALRARIKPGGIMQALNREAVKFTNGAVIQFKARSGPGGRGFSSDCLMLDEAQILTQRAWVSINSTMSAMPNPQVWLMGTPPTPEDDGAVFGSVRSSAMAGKSTSVAWLEWAADPADDPALELTRWSANPAWNSRINHEIVDGEFETYPADRFALDRLGIWASESAGGGALDLTIWQSLLDASAARGPHPVLGVDADEAGLFTIGAAWSRPDRALQVMVTQDESSVLDLDLPRARTLARLGDMAARFGAPVVLGGPAVELAEDLERMGVTVLRCNGVEFAGTCHRTSDAVTAGEIHHYGQPQLDASVKVARWRSTGAQGERAWQLKDSPGISPLAAVTRAAHGAWDRANYNVLDSVR